MNWETLTPVVPEKLSGRIPADNTAELGSSFQRI
jgi:hypothetical protein